MFTASGVNIMIGRATLCRPNSVAVNRNYTPEPNYHCPDHFQLRDGGNRNRWGGDPL